MATHRAYYKVILDPIRIIPEFKESIEHGALSVSLVFSPLPICPLPLSLTCWSTKAENSRRRSLRVAILRPSQAGEGGAVVASFGTVKLNPDWNGFTLKKKMVIHMIIC